MGTRDIKSPSLDISRESGRVNSFHIGTDAIWPPGQLETSLMQINYSYICGNLLI